MQVELLKDKSRLQEIYDLRVNVWENSQESEVVNRKIFPNGWFDKLDETGNHMIIVNDANDIIAAARLNIFSTIIEFPYYESIKLIDMPSIFPFGFYSRLVVDKAYQGNGLSNKLDRAIFDLALEKGLFWIIGLASIRTKLMVEKLDFKLLGQTKISYHKGSTERNVNVIIKKINPTK